MKPKYVKCSRCGYNYDANFFDDCPNCALEDEKNDWYEKGDAGDDYFDDDSARSDLYRGGK